MRGDPTREGDIMKIAMKAVIAAAAICALTAPACAYTISGTIPGVAPGKLPKSVVINLQPFPQGASVVKFTLNVGSVNNNGVRYLVSVCLAPKNKPLCGPLALSVPPGVQAVVPISVSAFPANVLTLTQGTTLTIPYTLDVDYWP
jgi:hypothetical protein